MTPGRCNHRSLPPPASQRFRNLSGEGLEQRRPRHRFLAGWATHRGQQFCASITNRIAFAEAIRKKLHQRFPQILRNAHALAVSDYGFGRRNSGTSAAGLREAQWCVHVTLDARYHLHRYAKAASPLPHQTKPSLRQSMARAIRSRHCRTRSRWPHGLSPR